MDPECGVNHGTKNTRGSGSKKVRRSLWQLNSGHQACGNGLIMTNLHSEQPIYHSYHTAMCYIADAMCKMH